MKENGIVKENKIFKVGIDVVDYLLDKVIKNLARNFSIHLNIDVCLI